MFADVGCVTGTHVSQVIAQRDNLALHKLKGLSALQKRLIMLVYQNREKSQGETLLMSAQQDLTVLFTS